jgi:hypothetical protein
MKWLWDHVEKILAWMCFAGAACGVVAWAYRLFQPMFLLPGIGTFLGLGIFFAVMERE